MSKVVTNLREATIEAFVNVVEDMTAFQNPAHPEHTKAVDKIETWMKAAGFSDDPRLCLAYFSGRLEACLGWFKNIDAKYKEVNKHEPL